MTSDVSPLALLGELRAAYRSAERFAGEVFEFRNRVATPAFNELRYAGHHLLRALDDDGNLDAAQLRKAIAHCHRAQYEAAEAGIISALGNIRQFREDYKSVSIGDVVRNYQDIIALARQGQNMLSGERSAERVDAEGQLPDPVRYMKMFGKLREACCALEYSRDELAKLLIKAQRERRRFIILVLLSIIGIFIAIF